MVSKITSEQNEVTDEDFVLRNNMRELSIEAYFRDCAITEPNFKELLSGASSSKTINQLQARVSFAILSKLIPALEGSITWIIDEKTLSFTIKYPIKVSVQPTADNANHEFEQLSRVLDSKLSDIIGQTGTVRQMNFSRLRASSPAFEETPSNVLGPGIDMDFSFVISPLPYEKGEFFVDKSVVEKPTYISPHNSYENREKILFIGEYIPANTSINVSQANSIEAAKEMIEDRHANNWSVIVIQVLLTTLELEKFIFFKSRYNDAPVVGNRDCASGQLRYFDDVVKFPCDLQEISIRYRNSVVCFVLLILHRKLPVARFLQER